MPHRITIEDSDIRAAETALGEVRFRDEYRMAALRCCGSKDIQACPGSGKTTILVAKLAILAQKWRWKDRGILVLSHTNVARQEVQEKLARVGGHKLLEYPHFVGTIQKFANQFLALPYLRSKGVSDARVDSNLFVRRLEERYVTKCFAWPLELRREWRRNPALRKTLGSLRYEFKGNKLRIASREGELPQASELQVSTSSGDNQESATFALSGDLLQKIYKAKNFLAIEEGIFCYDDMYALAQKYIYSRPWVARGLGWRFPWIFIDEMQDTDSLQDHLLLLALGDAVTVQRIGDTNQAIFGSIFTNETSASFPAEGALQLPGSIRYCPAIADIARPLTRAHDFQELTGNSEVSSKKHTIFTFDRETIGEVLPAFGRLLQEQYSDGFPENFRAKAVGARKTGKPKKEDNYPFCLSDYFGGFMPAATSTATTFSSFIEYAQSGRARFEESGDFSDGWKAFVAGCLEALKLQGVFVPSGLDNGRPETRRYSRSSLLERFSRAGYERELRTSAFALLTGRANFMNETDWQAFVVDLWRLLASCLDIEDWSEESRKFFEWAELGPSVKGVMAGKKVNTYFHKATPPSPDLEIGISTIHAAKGETHTATLVLDTFERTHDLKSVLPFLLSNRKKIRSSDKKRMKRTFVAITRPRELLCLALRRDHIKAAQRRKLEKAWNFVDL